MGSDGFDAIMQGLGKVGHPLAGSMTLPPLCYHDEAWLERERAQIFGRGWVAVGRADRWPEAGDYAALDLAGVPLVVMRDNAGRLRAWANSCRHRGMKLLSGEGRCKVVACPFHAWTYDLNGALISAPRMETSSGFDPADFGLTAFRLECQDGFAFVCLDPEQRALEDWLGDFAEVHQPWALEEWVSTRVREFQVACNWKLFIEVFNEYYHLPYVHPHSIADAYLEPEPCDAVIGEYTTQFGATKGSGGLLEENRAQGLPPAPHLRGRDLSGTRYTWVYPNLTFAACFDALWMYQAYPVTAASCNVIQTIAFPRASTQRNDFAARAQTYYQRIDQALKEDLPFLHDQQTGLASRFARQGRFSALEPSVGNFACWYAEAMHGAGQTPAVVPER